MFPVLWRWKWDRSESITAEFLCVWGFVSLIWTDLFVLCVCTERSEKWALTSTRAPDYKLSEISNCVLRSGVLASVLTILARYAAVVSSKYQCKGILKGETLRSVQYRPQLEVCRDYVVCCCSRKASLRRTEQLEKYQQTLFPVISNCHVEVFGSNEAPDLMYAIL